MNLLGDNIRFLRKRQNYNQADIAKAIGVLLASASDYERGKTEPKIETIINIADHFNVSIDALLRMELNEGNLVEAMTKGGKLEIENKQLKDKLMEAEKELVLLRQIVAMMKQ